jgi:hypothetical protein
MVDWGGAGKGAASGAALGSVAGPYGAAIGGVIGGVAGLFGGGDDEQQKPQYQDRDRILQLINQGYAPGGIASQQAPQLQMGNDPFRAAQLQQMGQLQGIASGQQQGAGELATQRQYANALAAQQAQARMARGTNAALAYRNAANQSAALGSSAAGMSQQAALQDQMNAHGLLGQIGASGRGADINVANANAGYQQATQNANAGNYMALLQALGGMDTGQLGAQAAAQQYAQQRNDALLGAGIGAAGQLLAARQRGQGMQAQTPDVYSSGDITGGTGIGA